MNIIEYTILQNQLDSMIALRSTIKDDNMRLLLGDRILKTKKLIEENTK